MTRRLANWLGSYAKYTEVSEAPETFNFWSGVSAIAGALRRRVWIDQIRFKWTPNFYIVFVAPPGVATKSTTVSVGMNLLKQVDGVIMGPQSLTWQGLTSGLQDALRLVPMNQKGPISDDGTPFNDFFNKSYITMSAITCEISELGTMLDPRDPTLMSVLIDMWDGREGKWERWLRSKENTAIENPWINIIGATTPSWLNENFPETMIGGGLTSRIIFVYADKKKYLIPYIQNIVDSGEYKALEDNLVHDLEQMAQLTGEFIITPEAIKFGSEWYAQHWQNPEDHLKADRLQGYVARKQTHIHKLAMVLSASESDEMVITTAHLKLAMEIMSGVERDMHIVFRSIGMHQAARDMEILMSFVRANKRVLHQELWQECYRMMSWKEFAEAMDSLVRAGYIRIVNEMGTINIVATGTEPTLTGAEPISHSLQ